MYTLWVNRKNNLGGWWRIQFGGKKERQSVKKVIETAKITLKPFQNFPDGAVLKTLPANAGAAGDTGSISG